MGGLDLLSLDDGRSLYQLPVDRRSPSGRVLPPNPFWIEPHGRGLRAWFVPDAGRGAIQVYDLQPWRPEPALATRAATVTGGASHDAGTRVYAECTSDGHRAMPHPHQAAQRRRTRERARGAGRFVGTPIITSVDFTIATASSPRVSLSARTASAVTIAVIH